MERWSPGDHITLRLVGTHHPQVRGQAGRLWGWPYIVVTDSPDLLALWMPVGTHMPRIEMGDRSIVLADNVHGTHRDPMRRGDVLRLMQPGKPHSIWLHWSPEPPHTFLGWYVNLEAPFVRTQIGVDTTDNSLDLVVLPDYSWHWKDEDVTQHWIDLGIFSREDTDQFYRDGRAVIADLEARRFPFDGSWLNFRPDVRWGIPTVAEGWDRVPGYDLTLTTGRRVQGVDHPRD